MYNFLCLNILQLCLIEYAISFVLTRFRFLSKNILLNGLRGDGTPPLYEVLPFEINNGNYFLLIILFVLFLKTFRVTLSV